jgi:hypothetical protein
LILHPIPLASCHGGLPGSFQQVAFHLSEHGQERGALTRWEPFGTGPSGGESADELVDAPCGQKFAVKLPVIEHLHCRR